MWLNVSDPTFLWAQITISIEQEQTTDKTKLSRNRQEQDQSSEKRHQRKKNYLMAKSRPNRWSNSLCVFVKRSSSSLSCSSSSSYFLFQSSSYLFCVLIAEDCKIHDSFRVRTPVFFLSTYTDTRIHSHANMCPAFFHLISVGAFFLILVRSSWVFLRSYEHFQSLLGIFMRYIGLFCIVFIIPFNDGTTRCVVTNVK